MSYIVLGASCAVQIPTDTHVSAIACLEDEFRHHLTQEIGKAAIVGVIDVVDKLNCPPDAILFYDKRLYADGDSLYCLDGASTLRIHLTEEQFNLTIDHNADSGLLALVLQSLLNWYMPKCGLVFLHAASFRYKEKVYTIHGFGGAGKTEVMLEALQRGAEYFSDDLAIFDSKGHIYPYLRKISLHDYPFTDEQLNRFHLNKQLYHLMCRCQGRSGRISQYLYNRWRGRFKVSVNAEQMNNDLPDVNIALPVDYNYWLDSSNHTDFKVIAKDDFVRKITFCMQNEFRPWVDFDGYLGVVYHFWPEMRKNHNEVLASIITQIEIQGLSIQNGHFAELTNLILNI